MLAVLDFNPVRRSASAVAPGLCASIPSSPGPSGEHGGIGRAYPALFKVRKMPSTRLAKSRATLFLRGCEGSCGAPRVARHDVGGGRWQPLRASDNEGAVSNRTSLVLGSQCLNKWARNSAAVGTKSALSSAAARNCLGLSVKEAGNWFLNICGTERARNFCRTLPVKWPMQ
jgi:hypothetical protein